MGLALLHGIQISNRSRTLETYFFESLLEGGWLEDPTIQLVMDLDERVPGRNKVAESERLVRLAMLFDISQWLW